MGDQRAVFDEAKAAIRAAWTAKPQQLWALGAAARSSVETDAVAVALGFANAQAMLAAELPEIPADTVLHAAAVAAEASAPEVEQYGFMKMWLYARWVREAGLKRPTDLGAWVVRTVDEDGQPLGGKPFAKCSVEELERALEAAKKAGTRPPPPPPPTPATQWPYKRVVPVLAVAAVAMWLFTRRSNEAIPEPAPEPVKPETVVVVDAGEIVLQPIPHLRPTQPTLRASPEREPPLTAPTPIAAPVPAPAPKADVGPDLTQEQLDKILLHSGPVTHPVE